MKSPINSRPKAGAEARLNALMSLEADTSSNHASTAYSVSTYATKDTERVQAFPGQFHASQAISVSSTDTDAQQRQQMKYDDAYGRNIIGAHPLSAKDAQVLEQVNKAERKEEYNFKVEQKEIEQQLSASKMKIKVFGTMFLVLVVLSVGLLIMGLQ